MKQNVNWLRTGALAGLAFGLPMGAMFGWVAHSRDAGVVGGVLAAVFFGLAMGGFGRAASDTAVFEQGGREAGFEEGEAIVFAGPANHFKGMEGVGGKLYLTDSRLRFRSHALNVQRHDESYPLADVTEVEAYRTLGIIPNGLRVELADGRRERFVVHRQKEWVEKIRSARTA